MNKSEEEIRFEEIFTQLKNSGNEANKIAKRYDELLELDSFEVYIEKTPYRFFSTIYLHKLSGLTIRIDELHGLYEFENIINGTWVFKTRYVLEMTESHKLKLILKNKYRILKELYIKQSIELLPIPENKDYWAIVEEREKALETIVSQELKPVYELIEQQKGK